MERIVDNVFRLNPLFSLIPREHLDDKQKKWLSQVINKNNIYGLLRPPPEARLTVKVVNRDLAVLLQQLLEPKRLSNVFRSLGEEVKEEDEQYIIRLVLDNVLEVQHLVEHAVYLQRYALAQVTGVDHRCFTPLLVESAYPQAGGRTKSYELASEKTEGHQAPEDDDEIGRLLR